MLSKGIFQTMSKRVMVTTARPFSSNTVTYDFKDLLIDP